MRSFVARIVLGASFLALASCGVLGPAITPASRNVVLPEGPPVEEIVTNFDESLHCLRSYLPEQVTFAVGQVVDATGRESYADGGTGRFVSQGAAEMVQSAMFRAGASVVNRRDPAIMVTETQWGIRDIQRQIPVNFFISGSINSLDFIPGGGASLTVAGIGPRYRQNRILVGLDLSLTDAFTGRILASIPLQRQIFAQEVGVSAGRFFGDTLVSLDAGGQQREAVNFVLRQMLNLATFELLGQLVPTEQYRACRTLIEPFAGRLDAPAGAPDRVIRAAMSSAASEAAERETTVAADGAPQAAAVSAAEAADATRNAAARSVEAQVEELANNATLLAVRAISAAAEANTADTPETRATKTAEAMQLARNAVQLLQRAAELGLEGPQGDAAAVVVQRAFEEAIAAYESMQAEPELSSAPAAAPAPAVAAGAPPRIADPVAAARGGSGPASAITTPSRPDAASAIGPDPLLPGMD